MNLKKILIAASGTGGHVYPGISLAKEFKDRGYDATFVVTNNETSLEIIKNSGFTYKVLELVGMPRKNIFKKIFYFIEVFKSFKKSVKIIKENNPEFVIGMGGYISVPVIFAAKFLKKKVFIHEQNSFPGLANRLLNKISDITFTSFRNADKYFKNNDIVLSGYPVRKDIFNVSKEKAYKKFKFDEQKFTFLIFGGSLGAHKINTIALKTLLRTLKDEQIQVIHITGKNDYKEIFKQVKDNKQYLVFEYMHDIADAYAVSNLVICRAGAGAVSEIYALSKSAILIPYPYATDNHQFYNAQEIAKSNFVEVLEEKNLSEENLINLISKIRNNKETIISNKIEKLPQEKICDEIIKSIRNENV